MVTKELVVYISKELKAGKKPDEIRQILLTQNWKIQDIDTAFVQANKAPLSQENIFTKFFHNKTIIIALCLLLLLIMGAGVLMVYVAFGKVWEVYSLADNVKLTGTISPSIVSVKPSIRKASEDDCGTERLTLDMNGHLSQSKTGLDCFIEASKTCTQKKLNMVYELNQSNVTFNSTVSYNTSKAENGCKLTIKQGKISYTLPMGIPEDLLEPLLGPIRKLENTEGNCIFADYNDLTGLFEKLRNGDYGMLNSFNGENKVNQTGIYFKGTCEGSYFTALR